MKPRNELNSAQTAAFLASKGMARPAKYRNVAVRVDGIRFQSKLEASHYRTLVAMRECRPPVVRCFLRQVPFDLPAGVKYRADFLVFLADGRVEIHECKGVWTDAARLKRRQVEFLYTEPNGPFKYVVIK